MSATNTIPVSDLMEMFDVDDNTGSLTWRISCGRGLPQKPAGYIDRSRAGDRFKVGIRGRIFRRSRVCFAMYHGRWPDGLVDHANGDTLDDSKLNLREATRAQNNANSRTRSRTGFKGVKKTRYGVFVARISSGGHMRYLGSWGTPNEAHAAYVKAALETFGDFARAA